LKGNVGETFVSRIEHDLHGRQINAYKIIRNLKRTEKGNLRLKPTVKHTWLDYCQKLWTEQFNDNTTEGKRAKLTENCADLITVEELETTIKYIKSQKNLQDQTGLIMSCTNMHQKVFYINFLIS